MSDANSKRKRAIHFSDQVKAHINKVIDSGNIDWEADRPPSLKFVVKAPKQAEMRLEYKDSQDVFVLYDRDQQTQVGATLGEYSPENVTTPGDTTAQEIANKVKEYTEN